MNNTNTETFTNRMATIELARETVVQDFNSVPLVKRRAELAGPTERFASMEAVETALEDRITQSGVVDERRAALNDFLINIKNEEHQALPQWKKDQIQREEEEFQRAELKAAAAIVCSMTPADVKDDEE